MNYCSFEHKPVSAKQIFQDGLSRCKNTATKYTIFHALDAKRLEQDRESYKNLNLNGRVTLGIRAGFHMVIKSALIAVPTQIFLYKMWGPERPPKLTPKGFIESDSPPGKVIKINTTALEAVDPVALDAFSIMLLVPIIEEIIFRKALQGFCHHIAGPVQTICTTNTVFGLSHLSNAKATGSTRHAYLQTSILTLTPAMAILFYTTGGLTASLAAHITMNSMTVDTYILLVTKIKKLFPSSTRDTSSI